MIDIFKPIETKEGRPALYMGQTPDGRHVVADEYHARWGAGTFSLEQLTQAYRNVRPPTRKMTLYVGWLTAAAYSTQDANIAEQWKAMGYNVSTHVLEEPPA